MPKIKAVYPLSSLISSCFQSFFLNSSYFQVFKVLAFIGIWIATHIHILEPGKDAKIPLWGLDLWVLNPQSPQNKNPKASALGFYVFARDCGIRTEMPRSQFLNQQIHGLAEKNVASKPGSRNKEQSDYIW
jgi:hypothetical protein